jgi:hypothetical protein
VLTDITTLDLLGICHIKNRDKLDWVILSEAWRVQSAENCFWLLRFILMLAWLDKVVTFFGQTQVCTPSVRL